MDTSTLTMAQQVAEAASDFQQQRTGHAPKAVTVVHDGNFVGVAAPSVEIAARAVAAINAEWKSEPQPSNKDLFEYHQEFYQYFEVFSYH